MLAESNPGNADRVSNDAVYDLSLQHLESERNFLNTANPALRRLIIDQVRRLHLRGGHVEAMRFGQETLGVWRERLGRDHLDVLAMAVEVAIAMQLDGHAADARRLILNTRPVLEAHYGSQHEVTLLCANAYGADLRNRGQFSEALELDRSLLPKFEETSAPITNVRSTYGTTLPPTTGGSAASAKPWTSISGPSKIAAISLVITTRAPCTRRTW